MKIPLRSYWRLLSNYLKPQRARVALLGLLLAGNIALQLLNPQILRSFIDGATGSAGAGALLRLALLYIAAALANQFLFAYARYVGEDVGWTATNRLREDLAAHCMKLDLSFHKRRTPGEMIERIDGDVNALASFFSQFLVELLSNAVLIVGVLALLFREDWRVGLALTGFAFITMYVLLRIRDIAVPYQTANREASASFYGFLGERIAGTEDIRANGASAYVMRRFYELLQRWLPVYHKAQAISFSFWMASLLLFAAGTALALGLGAYLWKAGLITLGTVYILYDYTRLLQRPMQQIRTQLQELQRAGASIIRVEEFFATTSRVHDGQGGPLPAGALAVEFRRVSFAYEGDEGPVLHDLSFRLAPGQVLGLLGRTGSGKSTLARLLIRFYDPTGGEVRLGGVPVSDLPLSDLRRRIGMVTQDVQLFRAAVRDNLTFFDRSIPDERILAVLDELGMTGWYRSLPAGLETELDAGSLSAGEAQLLAFARVFLSDPGLVILDEASSRLDPATEQLIERAITRLLAGRTAIIIAHRLGTVQRADEILILEGGRILEHGQRERLAADPSARFHRLLRTGLEEEMPA